MTSFAPSPTGTASLDASRQVASAVAEIQAAIFLARQFPRDENQAMARMIQSLARFEFADSAIYEYPRGWKKDEETGEWVKNIITGPSVKFARELARVWGNNRSGHFVVHSDARQFVVRGFYWDLETNAYRSYDQVAAKRVQRKEKGKGREAEAVWVDTDDERELNEIVNRVGAKLERNAILHGVPDDLKEGLIDRAWEVIEAKVKDDPVGHRKKIVAGFAMLGILPDRLEAFLGHKLDTSSPAEITKLRSIWKSIDGGEATWDEFERAKAEERETASAKAAPGSGAAAGEPPETAAAGPGATEAKPEPRSGSQKPGPAPAEAQNGQGRSSSVADDLSKDQFARVQYVLKVTGKAKTRAQLDDFLSRWTGGADDLMTSVNELAADAGI